MYKILIVGSGGREHAIARALSRSSHDIQIYGVGEWVNPGMARLGHFDLLNINNPQIVVEYAQIKEISIVIIGSENQLAQCLADRLNEVGIFTIGPDEYNARLETDKIWARQHINNLYNPRYYVINEDDYDYAFLCYIAERFDNQFVIKAVGLRGGKGVRTHFTCMRDADEWCRKLLKEDGRLLIEEKLVGEEFSLLAFADGKNLAHMPPAKDYKKRDNNDCGPNTGGMGCITYGSNTSFLTDRDIYIAQTINEEVYSKLYNYIGILYGGFMKTADGIKVIEYNCRFGDPEAINLLESLQTDFVNIILAMVQKTLDKIEIHWSPNATVTTYLTAPTYPFETNKTKVQLPFSENIIYGKIVEEGDAYIQLGSRSIAVHTSHRTLEGAKVRNAALLSLFDKKKFYYRSDIALL